MSNTKTKLADIVLSVALIIFALLILTNPLSANNDLNFGRNLNLTSIDYGEMLSKYKYNIFFTSYNPEVGQTDNSPCIGAGMTDICKLNKQGIRTIALSQDIVGRLSTKPFHYGDKVYILSDNPQCNGEWQVEDTMNKRYKLRGDLFQPTRATNTSCWGYVYKLPIRSKNTK